MPKTASKRDQRYAAKSLFTDEPETSTFQNSITPKKPPARNVVGDQGVQNLKNKGRGVATASDEQDTPTQRKEMAAKAKTTVQDDTDELIGKIKAAGKKKGGTRVRANFD